VEPFTQNLALDRIRCMLMCIGGVWSVLEDAQVLGLLKEDSLLENKCVGIMNTALRS
jgi:serine/threonine protein phosphatase PrpC